MSLRKYSTNFIASYICWLFICIFPILGIGQTLVQDNGEKQMTGYALEGKKINMDGKVDVGYAFKSKDPLFHQWCFDYFNYSWHNSQPFVETRLKKTS